MTEATASMREVAGGKPAPDALAYWLRELADRPEALELPCDLARPAIRDPSYTRVTARLATSVAARLTDRARLAAFAVFLGKAANAKQFLLGVAVDGRSIPLKVDLDAKESFAAFAGRLEARLKEGTKHAAVGVDAIVRALETSSDPARHPLLDVGYGAAKAEGDLHLQILPEGSVELSYDAKLFTARLAARLLAAALEVFAQVAEDGERAVGKIALLSAEQGAELLAELSTPAFNWPKHLLLHELFEAKVDQTPDAVAVSCAGTTLSYRELEDRANVVAAELVRLGVGPDSIVALVHDRTPEMIVSILAALKAGGAYLPIEPDSPFDRTQYVFKDSGAAAVLTVTSLQGALPPGPPVVCVDALLAQPRTAAATRPLRRSDPDRLAYVIYTSGSTGLPKGVLIEHRNVVHLILAEREDFGVRGSDALMLLSSYTFDASIDQIWLALTSGAKLVLVDKATILDATLLAKVIAAERITHLDTVPSLLAGLSPQEVPTVKRIVVGGESCSVATARVWCEAVRLYNEYGPTETTVGSLRHLVGPASELESRVPIGTPIGLTRAYVLDWGGCLVPPGVRGELYIGGAGVTRGYLNRDELTREKFLPDPFALEAARMYRTGDLVSWRPEGSMDFFGRVDNQVKVRGFRIELGEIEEALLKHPDVTAAVVTVVGASEETRRLACHFEASRPLSSADAKIFLGLSLPTYMVPSAFMQVSVLPKTVAGKIDRKKLPAIRLDAEAVEAPVNRLELEVRSIWSQLLKTEPEQISVTRSFFELGGHSLLLTQVASRIQKNLGVALRVSAILAAPTIRAIASAVAAAGADRGGGIPHTELGLALPATVMQRGMYIIQQGNPRSTASNLPLLYEIEGELSEADIARACAVLVDRHEALRTGFFFQEGQILQKIAVKPRFNAERYDIDDGLDKAMAAFVRPFVLEDPPLFRAATFLERGRPRFLALDMHHIVSDGMSIETLIEDFISVVEKRALPDVGLRYFDYAAWLGGDAWRARVAAARPYWMDLLKDELPVLDLPWDFARPLSRQQVARDVTIELDRGVLEAIAAYAREHQATPFAFFAAVYSVLLSSETGSADTLFGFPTAGRPNPDLERVVGMFVNTLVFRSRIDTQQSFAALLSQAMAQVSASLRNEDYPFENLIEDLHVTPLPGREPIFDTMLSYEGFTPGRYACGGATLYERRVSQRGAQSDLAVVIREAADGYTLWFEYSADLFKRSTVERFARGLTGIIKKVLADKAILVGDLHTLSPQERDRIVRGFNDTDHPLPQVQGVHELFERHASERPNAPAVVMRDISWSYAQVNAKANAIAHLLREEGLGRDSIVGVVLDPCPEMLTSVLGILKAGAAFMPIDPSYPLARKTHLVKDSRTRVLLTKGDRAQDLSEVFSGKLVDLDDPALYATPRPQLKNTVARSDLAYVIYTSGSTGQPKGVMIEHGNLLNFAAWEADDFGITSTDVFAKYASFGFDASISEVVPTFISGACQVIVPADLRLTLDGLDAYYAEKGVTIAFFPTQFGEQFLRHADQHKLRLAYVGGEKLRSLPTDRVAFVNQYGPTECTVAVTRFRVDRSYESVPIGTPAWNTQIHILDRLGRICPVGVAGELCISGASVGRGYLNQPTLTAEKFVANPILLGKRMYRTGDLARWLDDGNVDFLGRIDTQVKVRGFRIELGEIEQALMALPGVRDASVVARENPLSRGDLTLVAFVTGSQTQDEAARKAELERALPIYMVPSRIVHLDAIPFTVNGKVDKRRLPAVELGAAASVMEPRTPIEKDLRRLYAEVLGLAEGLVSVEASFVAMGGHSLKAVVLLSALYRQLGLRLGLAKFIEASSIAEVARALEVQRSQQGQGDTLAAAPRDTDLLLTSSQSRIFAVQQLAAWSTAYNIPSALELSADVDLDRLAAALEVLVSRHDALQAAFPIVDGVPVQRFNSGARLSVQRLKVDDANLHVTLERLVTPFDLTQAPLMHAALLSTETRQVLALDVHHIVADGMSFPILLGDLEALYVGNAKPRVGPTFADYVWWEQSPAAQAKRQAEKSWWLEKFAEPPNQLDLPYDFDRPPRSSFDGDEVSLELPKEISEPLLTLAKDQAVTPMNVFLGAWALVLSRLGDNPDLVIGVPASGRHLNGTENIVGMFVNTVPLRLKLKADESFRAFCSRLGRETAEVFDRQSYQLNDLVVDLGLVRDPSRNPLFDVLLAWQEAEAGGREDSVLGLSELDPATTPAKFDLELTVENDGDRQRLVLVFSAKLFRRATAEKFMAHLRRVLEQSAQNPDLRMRDFRMLPPWEREMLLGDFNRTATSVPAGTLVDLFARHVRERPTAIAVEDGQGAYTFQEVDQRASVLAKALIAAGTNVDDVVGLSLERSRQLLVAILGILKAGAGYLPIEPDAPRDRAAGMLEDSGARLLVSRGESFGLDPVRVVAWDTLDWSTPVELASRATPQGTAYVIYTSGSTGKPKGVVIEHRSAVSYVASSAEVFGMGSADRILLFSSYTFDASVEQVGLALTSGARLVVPTKETLLDLEAFETFVAEKKITFLHAVPLFLSSFAPKRPLDLKWVISGGDICPIPVAERWSAQCAFFNEYGPTETTVAALRHRIVPADLTRPRLPVGKPVANTQIYILDWTGNLAPLGVAGEMYVGGAGVARGYLNNSALTSERFLPNPYAPGERFYKTGDFARWKRSGTVEFLGRADNQIKIRGFRIELGEIEAALLRHPEVAEAVVVVAPHGEDKRLCGYLVLRHPVAPRELRGFVARLLPSYMVPDALVVVPALPVTSSGKIDRKRLPEPVFDEVRVEDAPATDAEAKLSEIWSEVLKLPRARIPVERSFFELGGHSLLIMLAITRVQQTFGVRLSPADVFEKPTIRQLAAFIESRERESIVPIPKQADRTRYPLSSVQRRLFAIHQANPDSLSYNMPAVFSVEGRVTRERLEETVRTLFRRHASFRTSFRIEQGEPTAEIAPTIPFSLVEIESDDSTEQLMERLVQPFDLAVAPLARLTLVRRSSGDEMLFVDFHHIIMDGTSSSILWREVSEILYEATLSPLRIHYGDFAVWQASPEHQAALEQQRQFWLDKYATLPEPLPLPYDFRRPGTRNHAGDLVVVSLSKEELAALSVLSHKQDATLFVTLISAYFVFLSRITGVDDLVVGVPTAGRVHPDVQDILGMFVNTVPWRLGVPAQGSFLEFLAVAKKMSIEFLSREEYQLESLLDDLGVRAAAGRHPLFDVMFSYQSGESDVIDANRVKLHGVDVEHRTAKMDLTLIASESNSGLELAFEYATELFDRSTVVRLAGHFVTLLRNLLRDPGQSLATLEILAPAEREQLLHGFNATAHALPAVAGAQVLYEEWARRTPDAEAVVCGSVRWSYAEVDRRAESIAAWLAALGIQRNDRVAVLLDPCADQVPAILGVLKAGAAFVPIDASYPVGRQGYMLADSGARALLTRKNLAADLEYAGPRLDVEKLPALGSPRPAVATDLSDAAYVIYTSGSTGKPKGVVVEHGNLLNFALWYASYYGIGPGDGVSKYYGFSFDAAICDLFPACISGARVVVVPAELRLAPRELSAYFSEHRVVVAGFPTQFGEQFLRTTENPGLRKVTLGGEKLRSYRPGPWTVINAYGPTESTVIATAFPVEGPAENIPIGKPVWNTQVLVLDKAKRLCPIGVAGELCLSGKGTARGYLNNPALTQERFVPHPFEAGVRMYRTGDVARWLPDGNLEYLGRADTQVKVRGYRIELGEIERTLMDLPAVKEAVVVDALDQAGATYLVAYVVSPAPLDVPQLQAALAKDLPEYMVPAYFRQLDTLPLTPNGKVDRKALPPIEGAGDQIVEPPASEMEQKLLPLWSRVLGIESDKLSVTASFVDLGGHSLKAIALATELYRELGLELKVGDVFRHPTIRTMAMQLGEPGRGKGLGAIERRRPAESYPASSVQERMFLLQQMDVSSVAYNVPNLYAVSAGVQKADVARALAALAARHEAFRCSFVLEGLSPRVRVVSTVDLPLTEIKSTEQAREALVGDLTRPFDLAVAPLARAAWIGTEKGTYLFFDMHHAVTDGASMELLVSELTSLLKGEVLPKVRCDLVDCAVWERAETASGLLAKQQEYWRGLFDGGVPALELLTDRVRPAIAESDGATVSEEVPEKTLRALRSLAQQRGVSLYSLCLAAFNVFLSRLTRQEDVVVGTPVSGRWHPDMQGVCGMFVNTLVMRNRPLAKQPFLDLVQQVSQRTVEALDNQAFPFASLVEMLKEERRAGHNPLFDVMFVLNDVEERAIAQEALLTPCAVESQIAKFDLTLAVDEGADRLGLSMEYRTSLFRRGTVERYLQCLRALLEDIVVRPDAPTEALGILTLEDRQLVQVDFNRTRVDYPREPAVQRMFEAEAARRPQGRALVQGEQVFTYGDVEAFANRLAHRLIGLGVGRESVVGVLSPPSCELFIAELAVLKAGAAFLPLDHRYPRERLEFTLRDSGAHILLSARGLDADLEWPGARVMLGKSLFDTGPTTPPPMDAKESDLAYVIYTSGSTGRPKGVAVEHRSLVDYVHRSIAQYALGEGDRLSKYAGVSFDASIMEVFPALCSGAELHIVPDEIRLSPPDLEAWFRSSGITWAFLPTQLGEEFMREPRKTALRWLVVGGDRLRRVFPAPFTLVNEYGPTEFTVSATTFLVDQPYDNVPIGKPNPNTAVFVLDPAGQLCPPSVPGEICLVGSGIARGYVGAPELTAKKFAPHPLAGDGKLYRTGDLGRWLADGNLEFLGRIDSQVKIRGFRIELGEIEQAILEIPGVTGSVAVDLADETGDKFLCGYFVAPSDVTPDAIRDALRQRLPDYMVPTALVRLEEIPFTTSGKVDRKRLPAPEFKRAGRSVAPAENVAQALVIGAFERALGASDLQIDDDFFVFGGNSLKAIAAVAALASDFRINANDLFRLRTARNIAREIPLQRGDLEGRLTALAASMRQEGAQDLLEQPENAASLVRYRERCEPYRTLALARTESYRNILLTGATGFLGCYLLRDLLSRTDAKIYVAVRAANRRQAWDRLAARAAYYFGPGTLEAVRRRIIVVPSNLEQPSLGLDRGTFDGLASSIDCAIHVAALTKHYGDLSAFLAANVDATYNVIALVRQAKCHLNVVSTTSVAAGDIEGKASALFTEFDCDVGQVADNHYVRTKLTAEKAAIALREEGLIANIFRVGFLTGDSSTLRFQENADDSGFVQKLRSFMALGAMPEGALIHSFCPVNEVSDAILRLMSASALLNETHHIERFTTADDAQRIAGANPQCRTVDDPEFYEWLAANLKEPGVTQAATAMLLHEGLLDGQRGTEVVTLREKTDLLLARLGFQWSTVAPRQVWSLLEAGQSKSDSAGAASALLPAA